MWGPLGHAGWAVASKTLRGGGWRGWLVTSQCPQGACQRNCSHDFLCQKKSQKIVQHWTFLKTSAASARRIKIQLLPPNYRCHSMATARTPAVHAEMKKCHLGRHTVDTHALWASTVCSRVDPTLDLCAMTGEKLMLVKCHCITCFVLCSNLSPFKLLNS